MPMNKLGNFMKICIKKKPKLKKAPCQSPLPFSMGHSVKPEQIHPAPF